MADVEAPVVAVVEAQTVEALVISKARSKPLHEGSTSLRAMSVNTAAQNSSSRN